MLTKPMGQFVRLPVAVLESLFGIGLSGTEWEIVMWTIRFTFGWNRDSTRFSWYRVAKTIGRDRAAVYRAGRKLVAAGLLVVHGNRVAIQTDSYRWHLPSARRKVDPML